MEMYCDKLINVQDKMKFHKIIVPLRSLDTTTIIANSALSTTLAMYHLISTHGMITIQFTVKIFYCTWTVSK